MSRSLNSSGPARGYGKADGTAYSTGNPFTIRTVSEHTFTTCPINLTMYSGSPARFGSLMIPLRLSSLGSGPLAPERNPVSGAGEGAPEGKAYRLRTVLRPAFTSASPKSTGSAIPLSR